MEANSKTKMIRGGRALAAALAGAQLFVEAFDRKTIWVEAHYSALGRFQHLYNGGIYTGGYAVRASDARRVLGRDRNLPLGESA